VKTLLGLDRDAPETLRAASILAFTGGLLGIGFYLINLRRDPLTIVILAQIAYGTFFVPSTITRLERWAYWLNAVLMAPIMIAVVGFLVFAETKGWLQGTGLILAYRVLCWGMALSFAGASILCLLPASKRAADAARTPNGVPIA
jgi:hypothetical protein